MAVKTSAQLVVTEDNTKFRTADFIFRSLDYHLFVRLDVVRPSP